MAKTLLMLHDKFRCHIQCYVPGGIRLPGALFFGAVCGAEKDRAFLLQYVFAKHQRFVLCIFLVSDFKQ